MEFQEVDIFIEPDGRVRIEVRGVKGLDCLDLTRALEEALGGQVESREMTSDAYDSAQEEVPDRLRQQRGPAAA